ncbi:MAG: ABC transporter substrate-binding protein [Pseudomonadota bacterium]
MRRRASLMDRRALFASATAAALLAATGVSAAGPRHGGRLRVALSGALRSDTWARGQGLFMQMARQGVVFDTLTEVAADGTLHGELATGWTSCADARVWTFDLRNDVTFHDGARFTAQDVVASAAGFDGAVVTARGLHQVQFDLDKPDARLPLRLSQPDYYIAPAHALNDGIGTGLYQVVSFNPGQRLLARRVDAHYKNGKAGWFDEVELTSIPSEDVRVQALAEYLVDAVDLTTALRPSALEEVAILPNARQPMMAVSTALQQPAQISRQRPLDNLRAAERWWFG